MNTQTATLGGGCFWCLEAVYKRTDGILEVRSGYAGGTTENPTYQEVCSGTTGHAEVIQIQFDSDKISYEQILDLFWIAHDPTTVNRQGADIGTQYRSIILTHGERQKKAAVESKQRADASGIFKSPIVTEIEEMTMFYPAEDYHQDYYENNPKAGYCRVVIAPKLDKLGLKTKSLLH